MTSDAGSRPPLAFIVTAAGSGTRMGDGPKKEYRNLGDRSVLETTVLSFLESGIFSFGLITCPAGKINQTKELLSPLAPALKRREVELSYCEGGAERQQSVFLGLEHLAAEHPELSSGTVLIHDGARPWISVGLIRRVAEESAARGGCAPVTPSVDAMKQVDEEGIITRHLPRKQTVAVQTPQGFRFSEIIDAHRRASTDGRKYIDDTEIYGRYVGDVYTVGGEVANRKITYAEDLG